MAMTDGAAHVHNPWLCPAHVTGCECPDPAASVCNPYRVAGHCPDDLEVMTEAEHAAWFETPETWTPEQVEEFRKAWDEHWARNPNPVLRVMGPPAVVRDLTPYGSVIIEWGRPPGGMRPMPGWGTTIYDTVTGDLLPGVSHLRLVDVDACDALKAELTMWADEQGNPSAEPHQRDGEVITGVFRFDVSEMRIRKAPAPALQIEPHLNAVGATVTEAVCPACREPVPVTCGDVTGMTLDEMIDSASEQVKQQAAGGGCSHEPVKVGRF